MGDFTILQSLLQIILQSLLQIILHNPCCKNLYSADQLSGSGDLSGVVILEEEGVWLARARREVESQAKKMLMQGLELMVSSELRDFPYSILVLHCTSLQQLMVS